MRILYSKSTEKRRPEFQIYTSIIDVDGKRYAVKQSVYDCGKKHIFKIAENEKILRKVFGDCVLGCFMKEDKVYFPFAEGDTYTKYCEQLFQKEADESEIRQSLMHWKQLICGNDKNRGLFHETDSFCDIFGTAKELEGDNALVITNFDCIADNLILSEDGVKMIDYEWVFAFLIPEEFVFYRVLKIFFLRSRIPVDFKVLLSLAGIHDEKTIIYERLLQKFDNYISRESATGVDYTKLGQDYKRARVWAQNMDAQIRYEFPFKFPRQNCNVILYGAGDVGMSYCTYIMKEKVCNITAWVDKKYELYQEQGLRVQSIESIEEQTYDYVLIAVYNDEVAREVQLSLAKTGIEEEKILWRKPQYV